MLQFFPMSAQSINTKNLVNAIIFYCMVAVIVRLMAFCLGWVPLVGWILGIGFYFIGFYCGVGVILAALVYFGIIH